MKLSAEVHNFDKKLNEFVIKEPNFWFFTSKVFNDKKFTGKFDDSKFNLSSNTYITSLKHIRIIGNYKKNSENLYSIEYNVGLPKQVKIFTLIIFLFFAIVMNLMILKQNKAFVILPNLIFTFFILFSILFYLLSKVLIKKKFENEFELKNIHKV